jgi:ABC-type antimicrobial peptide transport system permease subunit
VVGNTKIGSPDEDDTDQWFAPAQQPAILQPPQPSGKRDGVGSAFLILRSSLPPEQMRDTLRATISSIDPLLVLRHIQTMNDVVSESEAPRRFNTGIISAFALGALALAITGIYAVVASSVSLRTQEIAIRMALGAQRKGIARLVLTSGLRMALVGCGLGVLASFAVSRVVSSFLFGVTATDPMIYAASVLVMLLIALLASALPARRAASADPIQALRSI